MKDSLSAFIRLLSSGCLQEPEIERIADEAAQASFNTYVHASPKMK